MSTKSVPKQTPLKCLDCEHEFDGLAMHKEHYVESGSVLATTVFDRALVDCPNCQSHRVVARDEPLRTHIPHLQTSTIGIICSCLQPVFAVLGLYLGDQGVF